MIDLDSDIQEISNTLGFIRGIFDPKKITERISTLNIISQKENFWEDTI